MSPFPYFLAKENDYERKRISAKVDKRHKVNIQRLHSHEN